MVSSAVLLAAEHVGRRHPRGDSWLLEDASLEVAAGQRVALVGPSGSGKTLLLRALAMLDPVDAGRVLWRGQPVHGDAVPAFRRQALYVHQRPALWDDTVAATLAQPFRLRVAAGQSFDEKRVLDWLERLERPAGFLEKRVRELSGGEMQIVSLVRALQLDPTVLLLDEPTSALDDRTTRNMEHVLTEWFAQDAGRAIVWVTHDGEQAQRVSDRSVSVAQGRIISTDGA